MTGKITQTPCPRCKNIGGLRIETKFFGNPLGTWSLVGMGEKTTGRLKPVLKCSHCDLDLAGRFDGQHYAVFNPAKTEEEVAA